MNYKGILSAMFILGLIALVISCDKNLNKTDPNAVTVDQYFKNSTELQKGVNAAYSVLHSSSLVGREWFFLHDTRSDEMVTGGAQLEPPRFQMLIGTHDPTNYVLNTVWNALYVLIHRTNTVIENGPKVTDNAQLRDRTIAEAKFLRAWGYFELVSHWGGVPLYIATVKTPDAYQPRATEEAVYTQIIKDLNEAVAVLPGKSGTDKGRATASAANMLLGRVLMQKGDYTGAKAALLKIPRGGADGYALTNRYLDNFEEETEFNNETIFEVAFNDKGNNDFNWGGNSVGDDPAANQTTVRNQEYCPIAWRNLIPSNKYLNEFENTATGAAKTDPRYSFSVYQTGDLYNNGASTLTDGDQNGNASVVNGVTKKVSWRKYMLLYKEGLPAASFHPGGNNQRIMRYAEVLLMLAECENELSAAPGAIGYLNEVRARPSVAMPAYPTAQYPCNSKTEITRAIMHEKMVEMGGEEVRNVDIMRWRKKGYFIADPLSYFVAGKHELLPIPQNEIDNNPKLGGGSLPKQNPGY